MPKLSRPSSLENMAGGRLLFLSFLFPPVRVNAALRIQHSWEAFIELGFRVWVITRRIPSGTLMDCWQGGSSAAITRIPLPGLRQLIAGWLLRDHSLPLSWKKSTVISRFLNWRNRFPWIILLGDGGPIYILWSYLWARRQVRDLGITHLFTSFSPAADLLTAWLLKGRFPQLHWTADFRDLPHDLVLLAAGKGSKPRVLQRLLSRADALMTVSEGMALELAPFHPSISIYRGCVVPPDLPVFTGRPAQFTLHYGGSLYPGLQELVPLIQTLDHLCEDGLLLREEIRWTYCGVHAGLFRDWLRPAFREENIRTFDLISRKKALQMCCESSVNLVLTWTEGNRQGILTTKLFDYLACGRPILAWTCGNADRELANVMASCGHLGYFHTGKESQMRTWIAARYQDWQLGSDLGIANEKPLTLFSRENRNQVFAGATKSSAQIPDKKRSA